MGLLRRIFRVFVHAPSPPPMRRTSRPVVKPIATPARRHPPKRSAPPAPLAHEKVICGKCYVIDGDTIVIGNSRIRLAGIDAPELEHPWGQKSKWAVVRLCKGQEITAKVTGELSYDRLVARCFLPDGRDIAAELVKVGLAIDWPKYSGGKYQHLEPKGIRKKLWRAHARQGSNRT